MTENLVNKFTIDLLGGEFEEPVSPFIEFVVEPEDSNGDGWLETVLKINVGDPALSNPYQQVEFEIRYDAEPTGMVNVNIGDSRTNNGSSGDAATQTNDAELNIGRWEGDVKQLFVYTNDNVPPPDNQLVEFLEFVPGADSTVNFTVANEFLAWDNNQAGGEQVSGSVSSQYLYALNGQPDAEGDVNYDIFAAFNRAIESNSRSGTGVGQITITLREIGDPSLLDLSNLSGTVSLEFTISREAAQQNRFSFYEVDDAEGTISGLRPEDTGYVQAALERVAPGLELTGHNSAVLTHSGTLAGGKLYAPILFPNGDRHNPFFAFDAANPGDARQMQSPSPNTFAFEDIRGGGDRDFNDLVVAARITGCSCEDALPELLDLTKQNGTVLVGGTLARDAGFDNVLYFYPTDARGRVDNRLPGTAGYEDAVRDHLVRGVSLSGENRQTVPVEFFLEAGGYYGIAMAVDDNLHNLVTVDDAFSTFGARIERSGEVFSFEDSTDRDFNDLVLTVDTITPV